MTIVQTKYTPGKFGLATEFSLSEMPLEYSYRFNNRFINVRGDAEKRQGITQLGSTITGVPTITGLHEWVDRYGNVDLFASGSGQIWRLNEDTNAWDLVLSGKDSRSRMFASQMLDKLITVNGNDRNFYTDDGGDTYKELKAIIEKGQASSTQTTATTLTDSQVTSWLGQTYVNVNDIVYNATRNAYGIITSVGATNLTLSTIGSAASGIGYSSDNQQSGDSYEIIDAVELNVIPSPIGNDNVGILTAGTTPTRVFVSGMNWQATETEIGDFVYNTTRNVLTNIITVSATNLQVASVAGQTANDSITLFKSAMPIATFSHVHYGRLYLIDARNQAQIKISGAGDPEDFTTVQRTFDAVNEYYNARQPQAEKLLCLRTFQQYLVAAGQRNVYADAVDEEAITTSADSLSRARFTHIGLFPQGSVTRYGLESIGGACIFAANDGLRNFNASFNANTFQTANISEVIKSEIANAIASKNTDPDEIQVIHYPRRNWVLTKVGDTIYNYNYTPVYQNAQITQSAYNSFSKFTGKFAQQKIYYVRKNGDLICAGEGGKVYEFDKGSYGDDGATISTALETGYLKLNEGNPGQESTQLRVGQYIKPIFETSAPITYTITAIAGYQDQTTDTASAVTSGVGQVGFASVGVSPIGGERIYSQKLPLRYKGERFRVRFETDSVDGPDIITGFTIYGTLLGKV